VAESRSSARDRSSGPVGATLDGVAAVVVNHDAGHTLLECVASLRAEGVSDIVVVDNASSDDSADVLVGDDPNVRLVRTGENRGYGAGANSGVALTEHPYVLVMNPDVVVHGGALNYLIAALDADQALAFAGPRVLETDGSRYPSARRFPTLAEALGHALLVGVAPHNRFTRRYRMSDLPCEGVTEVDWVSGACFLARRRALQELGGFDEAYFMYAEDTDLCWRARLAGWGVAYAPDAVVTHRHGVSTARHPYRMLVAHHRSVYRFAAKTSRGWRRALLPTVAVLLALRLAAACVRRALSGRSGGARRAE
jgi:N-acetylglucosaminyl-diphospho-decaprenol L-rhamnosyltransferase